GNGTDDASHADAQDTLGADCEMPDTVAPDTFIDPGQPALTRLTSASFAFRASEPATYECSLDGAAYAACESAPTFDGLPSRNHTLLVRAVDLVGNTDPTPAEYRWTQDSMRPQTQLTGGPASSIPVNSASATFTFASPDVASCECSLDAGAWRACASPATYGDLANGTHSFAVRAVDAAGNVDGTPPTRGWTVRLDGAPVARSSVVRDGDGFMLNAAGSTDPDGAALAYRWQRNGAGAGTGAALHYTAPDHAT